MQPGHRNHSSFVDQEQMTTDKFRLAIVGAGAISRIAHLPAALASPLVRVVAVIDPDTERASALCREFGVKATIGASSDDLGIEMDGAVVATPNHLHAPVASALATRGIHVLVEKPMAMDASSAKALIDVATSHGVTIAVGYHTRHSGACRALKHAVESNHFGRAIRFAHQDGGRGGWSPLSGYNLDPKRAGGGVLVTTGTHFLDRLIWLWGSPGSVEFFDNSLGGPESHCIARFRFPHDGDEITGSAIFSKVVSLAETTVVETTEGMLIMHSDAADAITFRPKGKSGFEYQVGLTGSRADPRSLYQRQLENFIAACQSGTHPAVDAITGACSVDLVARLYSERKPLSENSKEALQAVAHV